MHDPVTMALSSDRNPDASRLKLLAISYKGLLELLSLDGSRAVRITGLPADARIVGVSDKVRFDRDQLVFKIWSRSFSIVREGSALEYLDLSVQHVNWSQELKRLSELFPENPAS